MSSGLDNQPRGRSASGMAPVPENIVLTKDGLFEGYSDSTGMILDNTDELGVRNIGGDLRNDTDVLVECVSTETGSNQMNTGMNDDTLLLPSVGGTGTTENVKGVQETLRKCEWGVRGWCKIHLIYGKKTVQNVSKWTQKKNGLFGYVTSKKTSYQCMGDKEDSEASRDFVKPALSKNMGQRARLLGEGHT